MYNTVFGLPLNFLDYLFYFVSPFTIITNYKLFNKKESY